MDTNSKHRFGNRAKAVGLAAPSWDRADAAGIVDLKVQLRPDGQFWLGERAILNISSYDYLGLGCHPEILEGAISGIRSAGALNSSISRPRMVTELLHQAEMDLSELWGTEAVTTTSCWNASAALLPLLACGALHRGRVPHMAFDHRAHLSLRTLMSAVNDETSVSNVPHNDLGEVERLLRVHDTVCYVTEGYYSHGGSSPANELLAMQDRYPGRLWLVADEAHSLSLVGAHGEGLFLANTLGSRADLFVVASLNKAFGASGGVILLGERGDLKTRNLLIRNGGPLLTSQRINSAGLGAIRASAQLHASEELGVRQRALQANLAYFDRRVEAEGKGDVVPIRFIPLGTTDHTVAVCERLLQGYDIYAQGLWFPIVPREGSGLRVFVRSDMTFEQIDQFATALVAVHREVRCV